MKFSVNNLKIILFTLGVMFISKATSIGVEFGPEKSTPVDDKATKSAISQPEEKAARPQQIQDRNYILEWLERESIAGNRSNPNAHGGARRARAFADNLRKRVGDLQQRANEIVERYEERIGDIFRSRGGPMSAMEKLEQGKYMTGSMSPAQMDTYEAKLNLQYELWRIDLTVAHEFAYKKWVRKHPEEAAAARKACPDFISDPLAEMATQSKANQSRIEFEEAVEKAERRARAAEYRAREAEFQEEQAKRKVFEAEFEAQQTERKVREAEDRARRAERRAFYGF